jgi:hypothetical protein
MRVDVPEAFTSPPVPLVENTNKAYGGWDMAVPRLFFATAHSMFIFPYTQFTFVLTDST